MSATATGLSVTGTSLTLTDDEAVPTVALSVSPESFAEDDAATAVTVTATASDTLASATISLSLGGTAAAADYSAAGTLSIAITNSTTGTTVLTFTPTQDLVYEGDETIRVSGTATGLTVTGTSLTLTDDEAVPTVALSVSPASFAEDDAVTAVTVTATLSAGYDRGGERFADTGRHGHGGRLHRGRHNRDQGGGACNFRDHHADLHTARRPGR